MNLIIDGDGCPVRDIAINLAKKFKIPAVVVVDINHQIRDDYAKIITVDKGFDAVDFKIISLMTSEDIVITQDYGLASLVLSKKGSAMDQNGMLYTEQNIDMLLLRRHISKNVRRSGGKSKGPSKRKKEDDLAFQASLKRFLTKKLQK